MCLCRFYSIIISNAFLLLFHPFLSGILYILLILNIKCLNFSVCQNKMVGVSCVWVCARASVALAPCFYVTVCGCRLLLLPTGRLGFRRTGFPLRGWEDGSAAATIQHIPGNQFLYDRLSLPRALDPSRLCCELTNEHTRLTGTHCCQQ